MMTVKKREENMHSETCYIYIFCWKEYQPGKKDTFAVSIGMVPVFHLTLLSWQQIKIFPTSQNNYAKLQVSRREASMCPQDELKKSDNPSDILCS